MKKFLNVLIALAFVVALFAGVTVGKAALLSYDSSIQVQNLEGTDASITIAFYNRDGSSALTVTDTVPANGLNVYFPLQNIGNEGGSVPAGFDGSVVVSSDKQIAAVVNVHGSNGSDPMAFGASYRGFNGGSTTVQLPLLMKGNFGYNTWYSVQNVGSSPADISVTYSDGVVATATGVQPGAAAKFDQGAEAHAAGWVGAGTVTSTQDVAIAALEVGNTILFAYNGFGATDPNPIMPLVNENNFGYTTSVNLMNVGSTATNVTVDYTPGLAGSACSETRTVNPGQMVVFGLYTFTNFADPNPGSLISKNCAAGATFIGSAKVTANTATQNLAVIVNQHNLNAGRNKGAAYDGFAASQGTATVLFPLLMDRNYGYFTSFSITNVGSSTITGSTVLCHMSGKDINGTTVTKDVNPPDLAPGQGWTYQQLNNIGNRWVGSGTCTGPGGSQMVGIVNELKNSGSTDTFLVYEAVNQ